MTVAPIDAWAAKAASSTVCASIDRLQVDVPHVDRIARDGNGHVGRRQRIGDDLAIVAAADGGEAAQRQAGRDDQQRARLAWPRRPLLRVRGFHASLLSNARANRARLTGRAFTPVGVADEATNAAPASELRGPPGFDGDVPHDDAPA